jgi:hypothetical protein
MKETFSIMGETRSRATIMQIVAGVHRVAASSFLDKSAQG